MNIKAGDIVTCTNNRGKSADTTHAPLQLGGCYVVDRVEINPVNGGYLLFLDGIDVFGGFRLDRFDVYFDIGL